MTRYYIEGDLRRGQEEEELLESFSPESLGDLYMGLFAFPLMRFRLSPRGEGLRERVERSWEFFQGLI